MQKKNDDLLARYDEQDLVELSEAETFGGTGLVCVSAVTAIASVVTAISQSVCPTTKCTSKC